MDEPIKAKSISTDQAITRGKIEGTNVSYAYGVRTYKDGGNFTALEEGSVSESIKEEHIVNTRIPLVNESSFEVVDIIYEVHITAESAIDTTFTIKRWNNDTFWARVAFANSSILGNSITKVIEDYDTTEVTMKAIPSNETIGRFTANVTYAEWTSDQLDNAKDANVTWIIYPKTMLVKVQYIDPGEELELNVTINVESVVQYYSYYSVAYNISVQEWFANIRDGNRMSVSVSAFKNLNLNYTEVRSSVLWYSFTGLFNVTLKYQNGTEVPFEKMPFSLRPAFSNTHGVIQEVDIRHVQMKAISTTNSILQAFHARFQKNLPNATVTAQSFVAWMIRSVPRLIVYKDGNLDHQLNLEFSPDEGLHPTDGDIIPLVGVTEAYRGWVGHRNIFSHQFNETQITFDGYTVNNKTRMNVNHTRDTTTVYLNSLGDVDSPFSQISYWNDPTVGDDGTIKFEFGVEYRNFPVTWYLTTAESDSDHIVLPMNITYDYVYEINPRTGESALSPTMTYGALPVEAQNNLAGLSLATMYRSDFMSLFGLKVDRTKDTKQNTTSSRAGGFTEVSFAGPDNEFSKIDHRGNKQWYTLDGVTHQTNVSVLNLFAVSVSAVGGNMTVFESETDSVAGSAYLQNTTIAKLDFKYRKDLILVSYPAWDGKEIVHDPTYSAAYLPSPVEEEPTSSNPSSTTTTTSLTSIDTSTTVIDTGVPGFEISIAIFSVISLGLVTLVRFRKNKDI
ncbi:MAG: hypothetical protein HeimC3_13140 [Candidatus Heimdallarchaeota archaeon LC_3]|nr:MAG: hypothetical protein HeimC3_13140 [Candidatus Heimdallarchaeota archaeon LC_3]